MRRYTISFLNLALAAATLLLPFASISCRALQRTTESESVAVERLRKLARSTVAPPDDQLADIEIKHLATEVAALSRLLRARTRLNARNFNGALSLLNDTLIRQHSLLGDYALQLRARALEGLNRSAEARTVYDELRRDFPNSPLARDAALRSATIALQTNSATNLATLDELIDKDDAAALLLAAQAAERAGDQSAALKFYRRINFYAPASNEAAQVAARLQAAGVNLNGDTAAESLARADRLFEAKRYAAASDAYADSFARFPSNTNAQTQLRRGIAANSAKRYTDAIAALTSAASLAAASPANKQTRLEAFYNLTSAQANAKQWSAARQTTETLLREYPRETQTARAVVLAGQAANAANNKADAMTFFRRAVSAFSGAAEVAGAQFEIAWAAHDAKSFAESSRLLTEHLAVYADRNTDNRGRAGYWAARDSERAGKLNEAIVLYRAMLQRYDANWYGYLAQQRLDALLKSGTVNGDRAIFAPDSPVGRAVANLSTVTVADERYTADENANQTLRRVEQLLTIAFDDEAFTELQPLSAKSTSSPRVNLMIARLHRARGANVEAINVLRRSYPDYAQMKPEEMTRDEWDVFYPLTNWDIIKEQAAARSLDPYQVAGLIRQESVFDPRAASPANAYGLMQLLLETARRTASAYGINRQITIESLFEPRLNIQLGTAYMKDQLTKYGRVEYMAAAYNAGPGRVVQWRQTLPLQIDEWAEAIPFRETRGYVQGVVRNTMQYKRLYDERGQFKPEVGAARNNNSMTPATNDNVRPRRTNEELERESEQD